MNRNLPQETRSKTNTRNQQLQKYKNRNTNKIVFKLILMLQFKDKQTNFRKNPCLQEEIFLKMIVHLRFNLQQERWVEELEVYCKEAKKKKDSNRPEDLLRYREKSSQARRDYLQ